MRLATIINGENAGRWVSVEKVDGTRERNIMDSNKVKEALEIIRQAMIDDNPGEPGSYAHAWHCNIAISYINSIPENMNYKEAYKIGNEAASRFMKLCFGVETKG